MIFFAGSLLLAFLYQVSGLEREMTIQVNAGSVECFYERVEENHIIDIEYQVNKISLKLISSTKTLFKSTGYRWRTWRLGHQL